jgi:hypothetical protein
VVRVVPERFAQQCAVARSKHDRRRVACGKTVLEKREDALEKLLIRGIDERLMSETRLRGAQFLLLSIVG